MLPKFMRIEDAYLFLKEFEEVYSMMCYPNMPLDIMPLKFIPFTLKDGAKNRCMAYLPTPLLIGMDFVSLFAKILS